MRGTITELRGDVGNVGKKIRLVADVFGLGCIRIRCKEVSDVQYLK